MAKIYKRHGIWWVHPTLPKPNELYELNRTAEKRTRDILWGGMHQAPKSYGFKDEAKAREWEGI